MDHRGLDFIAVEHPHGIPKEGFDLLPLWVADMNFLTVPAVQEAIIRRARHPAYGFFPPREEYCESIISWRCL